MATPSSCGDADEKFLVTDWNSLVNEDMDFDGSSGLSAYDIREPQCQGSNGWDTMVEQFPGPSPFNNVSIPAASALFHPKFCINDRHGNLKGKKRKSMPECSVLHPHPPLYRVQKAEAEQQKNVAFKSVESSDDKDEKKHKSETTGEITHKPNAENIKECSQDGDATKEDYSHVRARRGQATDSHSLAERVRRENISKRMRLLQDLVPGCNKITRKEMMLDEVINYVQSLQRQVEVLSMKLAAVDPELQFDIDRILSKDVLQSSGNLSLFGCGPGLSTPHPLLQRFSSLAIAQPEMLLFNLPNSVEMMSSSIPQIASRSQLPGVWDDGLQTALQMGFIPNAPVVGPDLNDFMKLEL